MDPALHAAPDRECRYDAFISYRHLPLDRAVAMRLQTLLENYRPPRSMTELKNRRIRRVFRDQSELPTSGDLGSDIRTALLSSRYLIVICSERFRDSVWCMEEVRQFKAAHGGRTDRILTLLVSGEPKDVFPPELTEEVRPDREGEGEHIEHIEPLSGDVRAPTIRKSLRLLNTEFLRIAAPLLGCGFDDLYQRHLRRRRRRLTALIGGTAGVLGCVLCVVSVFAYRTWVSEGNYRRALATTYLRSAAEYAVDDDPQRALLYYTEALALEPGDATAAAGAATLLQSCAWPMLEETTPGCLVSGQIRPAVDLTSNGAGTRFLSGSGYVNAITVQDAAGAQVAVLPQGYTFIDGEGKDLWAFAGDDLLLYDTATDTQYTLPWPADQSRAYIPDETDSIYSPSVAQLSPGRVAVAYGGLVRLYSLENGAATRLATVDLADALPEASEADGIICFNDLYPCPDGRWLAVSNLSSVVLYDASNLSVKAVVPEYINALIDVSFSADGSLMALNYGNLYPSDYANSVSYAAVYDTDGRCLFTSPEKNDETILGALFHPDQSDCLLVWGQTFLRIWNWRDGTEYMAPLFRDSIRAVAFGQDGRILADDGQGQVHTYLPIALPARQAGGIPDSLPETLTGAGSLSLADGTAVQTDLRTLTMTDAQGRELGVVELPQMIDRMACCQDTGWLYLYNRSLGGLWRVQTDPELFGELQTLDTKGGKVMALWFNGDRVFAQTTDSSLLVYDGAGALLRTIRTRQTGSLQAVVGDPAGTYAAVVLKRILAETGDYRFTESGVLELWSLTDGNLVASFEDPSGKITGVMFTDDGALAWADSSGTAARQIVMPEPDAADIDGLRGVCCLRLLADGETECRDPGDAALGAWQERLGDWQDVGLQGEAAADGADSEARALIARLFGREDLGSDAWYSEMDAVWRQVAEGTLTVSLEEIDDLYRLYLDGAGAAPAPGRLSAGVQAYCAWYQAYDWGSADIEQIDNAFDDLAADTLELTTEYDDLIAAAWQTIGAKIMDGNPMEEIQQLSDQLAGYSDQIEKTQTSEELMELSAKIQQINESMILTLMSNLQGQMEQAYAGMVRGDPQKLYEVLSNGQALSKMAGSNPFAFFLPALDLLNGDPACASRDLNDLAAEYTELFGEGDSTVWTMVYLMGQWADILELRGYLSGEEVSQWIAGLNVIPSMELLSVTPEEQQAGLMVRDQVIEVNGTPVLTAIQARRELGRGELTLTVLRGTRRVEIRLPQGSPEPDWAWAMADTTG